MKTKKIITIGIVLALLFSTFVFAGCSSRVRCVCDDGCDGGCNFLLTITVEETTLPHGENFEVHIELKNVSGRDVRIYYFDRFGTTGSLFIPHISGGWRYPIIEISFSPQASILHSNESIKKTWYLGELHYHDILLMGDISKFLSIGTHDIIVSASFHLRWRESSHRRNRSIRMYSNTVILTVV